MAKDYIPISEYNKLKEANGGKDLTRQQVSSYISSRASGSSKQKARNAALGGSSDTKQRTNAEILASNMQGFLDDYSNSYNAAVENYNSRLQQQFQGGTENNKARNQDLAAMRMANDQAQRYSSVLNRYGNAFNSDYTQAANDALNELLGAGKNLNKAMQANADYWGRFNNEEDYKSAMDFTRISELNKAKTEERIRQLEAENEQLKNSGTRMWNGDIYNTSFTTLTADDDKLRKNQEEIEALRADIGSYNQLIEQPKMQAQRNQYLTTLNLDDANAELASIPDQITSLTNEMRKLSMAGDHEGASRLEQQLYALRDHSDQLTADVREASSIQQYNAYMQLQQAPDFDKLSKANFDLPGTENAAGNLSIYEYINGKSTGKQINDELNANPLGYYTGTGFSKYGMLTDEEKGVYNYLFATQGGEAAYKFLQNVEGKLNEREMDVNVKSIQEAAHEAPVLMSGYSVVNGLMSGAAYLGQALDLAGDGQIDKNAGYNLFSRANTEIRGTVDNDIKEHWISKGKTGQWASFAYQTGMSMADFLFQAAVGGSVFGGGTKAAEAFTLAIMGTGAAANGTLEALDRGLSSSQAFTLGTIAGAAEIISEKISIEALFDEAALNTDALKYILQNFFFEGAEEVESDVINSIADLIISKDKSEWSMAIAQYQAQGMSEQAAFIQAMKDQAMSLGMDFLGGAVSGGIMGVGGVIGNNIRNYGVGKDIATTGRDEKGGRQYTNLEALANSLIEDAKSVGADTESGKVAADIEAKRAAGKKITMQDLGRLFESTTNAKSQALDMDENEYRQKYQAEIMSRRFENVAAAQYADEGKVDASKATRESGKQYIQEKKQEFVSNVSDSIYQDSRAKGLHTVVGTIESTGEDVLFRDLQSVEWDAEHGLMLEVEDGEGRKSDVAVTDFSTGETIGDAFTFAEKVCKGSDITDAKILSDIARTAIAARMEGDINTSELLPGFLAIFGAARNDISYTKAVNKAKVSAADSISKMSEAQMSLAYKAGENAGRIISAKAGDAKAGKAGLKVRSTGDITKAFGARIGNVSRFLQGFGREGVMYDNLNVEELKENGEIKESAQISVWQDPSSNRLNAVYVKNADGSVKYYFAKNAIDSSFMFVAMHESIHDIKANLRASNGAMDGQAVFDAMYELIKAHLEETGEFDAALKKHLRNVGVPAEDLETFDITSRKNKRIVDNAIEELVCDSVPGILGNEVAMERFAKMVAAQDSIHRNAFVRFFNTLKSILAEAIEVLQNAGSWKQIKSIRQNQELCNKLMDLYEDAYKRLAAQNAAPSQMAGQEFTQAQANDIVMDQASEITEMPRQKMSYATYDLPDIKPGLTKAKATKTLGMSPEDITMVANTTNGKKDVVYASGRSVLEAVMKKYAKDNHMSPSMQKATLRFMDRIGKWMNEVAVAEYHYIGLQDLNNAKMKIDWRNGKKVVLSARVKNGEYDVNFDLSKICKKRVAFSNFIDDLATRPGKNGKATMLDEVDLSPENIFKMNQILKDMGYETACLGCFVESRRYGIKTWAETIVNEWNARVDQIDHNAGYFDFAGGSTSADIDTISAKEIRDIDNYMKDFKQRVKDVGADVASEENKAKIEALEEEKKQRKAEISASKTMSKDEKKVARNQIDAEYNPQIAELKMNAQAKMLPLIQSDPRMVKKLRVGDLISSQGRTALHEYSAELESIVASRFGTSSPKSVEAFAPYNSEIALLPDTKSIGRGENKVTMTMGEYLSSIAGARSQSFSDFIISQVFDHLQKTADLAARGFKAHTYTKEIARAMLFGMTGEKINMSVMFDINPDVDWQYAGLEGNSMDSDYSVADYKHAAAVEGKTGEKQFTYSIPFAKAVEIEHNPLYSKDCGIIGVGHSYFGMLKMFRDERVPYIIGYHRSGMPEAIMKATHIELSADYTSVQNTLKFGSGVQFRVVNNAGDYQVPSYATWGGSAKKDVKVSDLTFDLKQALADNGGDGRAAMQAFLDFMQDNSLTPNVSKAVPGHGSFDLYGDLEKTMDPNKTANNYIAWCINNNMVPMFYEFAAEPEYSKILFDFSVRDLANNGACSPQRAVSMDGLTALGEDAWISIASRFMKSYDDYMKNQFFGDKYEQTMDMIYDALKAEQNAWQKFSVSDADYLALAEKENRTEAEEAQLREMVDQAAKDAGYVYHAYHGTSSAGFNVFDPQSRNSRFGDLNMFTTSKADADSYAGSRGRNYDPSEKRVDKESTGGSFYIGDYLRFDSEEDRNAFIEAHPNAEKYIPRHLISEYGEEHEWEDDFENDIYPYEEAQKIAEEIDKAYLSYERGRTHPVSAKYLYDNADMYGRNDFKRAFSAYDSNAILDEASDEEATDEYWRDAYRYMYEGNVAENTDFADMQFPVRILEGETAVQRDVTHISNRTYGAYIKMDNPIELDFHGEKNEFNSRYYNAIDELKNDTEHDGLIARNIRVGANKINGDVFIVRGSQNIKLDNTVLRDDNGNIIPLSQRFNEQKEDIRFSIIDSDLTDEMRAEINPDAVTALFIRNTAAQYVDKILSGEKTEETRTHLRYLGNDGHMHTFVGGEIVGIVNDDGMLVAYAKVTGINEYKNSEEFHTKEANARHLVPEGSEYDIKGNGKKYGLVLDVINKLSVPIPTRNDAPMGTRKLTVYSVEQAVGEKLQQAKSTEKVFVPYNDVATKYGLVNKMHSALMESNAFVTLNSAFDAIIEEHFPDLRGVNRRKRMEMTRSLKSEMASLLIEAVKNDLLSDGFTVELDAAGTVYIARATRSVTGHLLGRSMNNLKPSQARMLYNTRDIIKNGTYVYSSEHDQHTIGGTKVVDWDYFYTAVVTSYGEEVGMLFAVRNMQKVQEGDIHQIYSLDYNPLKEGNKNSSTSTPGSADREILSTTSIRLLAADESVPSSEPSVKMSVADTDDTRSVRDAIKENEKTLKLLAKLNGGDDSPIVRSEKLSRRQMNAIARELCERYGSSAKYKEVADILYEAFGPIFDPSVEVDSMQLLSDAAAQIVDNVFAEGSGAAKLDEMLSYLNGIGQVMLSSAETQEIKSSFGTFNAFKSYLRKLGVKMQFRVYNAKEAGSAYMSDSFFADLANSEVGYLFPYEYDGSQVMSLIGELDKLNEHKLVNVYGKGMETRENAIMEIVDELIARSAEYRSEAMTERISRQAGDVMSKEEEKRVGALAKQLSETAQEVRAQMERYQAEQKALNARTAEMVYESYQEDVLDYEEQIRVLNEQLKEIRSLDEKRRNAQRKTEQALSEVKSKLMSARDHLKARASSLAQMDAYYARELAVNVDAQAQMARAEARKEMAAKYKQQIEKLRNDKKLQAKDLSETMTAYNRALADVTRQAKKDVRTARKEGRLQRSAEVLERDLRRNYRARIAARTKTMLKMLNGTANVVVPEGARNTIGQFVDIMSQQNKKFDKDQLRLFAQFYRDMGKGTIIGDEAQDLQNMFDEDIADRFDQLIDIIGGKRISDLTSDELRQTLDITNVFYHIARHADDVRRRGRSESMKKDAMSLFRQLNSEADRKDHGQMYNNVEGFLVNNQTPYYFFKQAGGVLEKYYQDIDNGVRQYTLNVQESQKRIQEIKDQFNYDEWSKDTAENRIQFEAATHRQVSLTRGEAMLIWATNKREQINAAQKADHLRGGGIVLQEDRKNGKNKALTAVANRLTDENLQAIDNWLTPEQKACADALVQYLSADMAELGNEVTMQLYGIRKFEESYYIPYNCAGTYLNKRVGTGAVNLDNMLKTISFTQKLTTRADAPILVDDIFNVASRHIERMTMYNALCIPLDNMNRLMNYKTRERIAVDEDGHPIDVPVDGDGNPIPLYNEDGTINADVIDIHYDENGNPLTKSVVGDSIRTMLTAKRGTNAVKYIDQFIDDMNGGANTDPRESFGSRMLSMFKKNAVMMSMSVAIQQPSAIGRAFALVDPKYFAQGMASKGSYEELKKYSYTAVLKEIGGFDTGTGRGIADWINGGYEAPTKTKQVLNKIDEVGGYLPGKMDELTWGVIWRAIKLETEAKNPDLHGEDLLRAAGARFDEVINATQVYDSTISRSSNMRSKTWYMKAATAFMAEPTVGYNLLVDAVTQAKKGNAKYAGRAIASFAVAAIINSLLKSLVTAARKQDDDETYGEKYIAEVTGNMFSELNPFGLVPIAKDVISIFDGYTVSRSDMDAIQDIKDAYDTLMNDNKSAMDKINAMAAAVSITTGVPVRNVLRDSEAVYNVISNGIKMAGKGSSQGTRLAMEEALSDVWPFSMWVKSSNKDYAARIIKDYKAGDIEAVEATIRDYQFKLDRQGKTAEDIGKKTESWIKKAVKEAYDAKEIDYDTAFKLLTEIGEIAEKVAFKTLQAVDYDDTEYADSSSAYVGVYDAIDNGGDVEAAIGKMVKSGYEEKTVRQQAVYGILELYKGKVEGKAKISDAQARTMLTKYGKLSSDDAAKKIKEANVFLTYGVEYTSNYSKLKEALKAGTLSKEQAIKILMNVRGYSRDKAKGIVDKW